MFTAWVQRIRAVLGIARDLLSPRTVDVESKVVNTTNERGTVSGPQADSDEYLKKVGVKRLPLVSANVVALSIAL
jgi:hypothetical protein